MTGAIKIYHAGSEIEGEMILERLRKSGIEGFVSQTQASPRPKIYSGFSNVWGVDLYVHEIDVKRAAELLHQWEEEAVSDSDELASNAQNTTEIADDVKEFLEEQKEKKARKKAKAEKNGMPKSGSEDISEENDGSIGVRRRVAQISAILVLLFGVGVVIYNLVAGL